MKSSLLRLLAAVTTSGALIAAAPAALAQDTIKIGFVGPYTGPFAVAGQSFRHGVDAYMALHGNQAGGRVFLQMGR